MNICQIKKFTLSKNGALVQYLLNRIPNTIRKKVRIQTEFTNINPNTSTTLQQPSQTNAMPGSRKKERRKSVEEKR